MLRLTIEDNTLLIFSPFLLGYCNCGCGGQTGYYRKKQNKFIYGHSIKRGEECIFWKGGKFKSSDGYLLILKPKHPFCDSDGYIREHRLVMEQHIGRYLTKNEEIHHINENKLDNRIENLLLFSSKADHTKLHMKKPRIDMSGRFCFNCGSKETWINKKGRPHWEVIDNQILCNKCGCKLRYKKKNNI